MADAGLLHHRRSRADHPPGPSILQAAGASTASTGPNLAITSAVIVVMLAVAVVGIRLTARTQIALPPVLGNVSARFATPVAASVLTGALLLGLIWVYLLGTSVQNTFGDLLSVSSWLTIGFYILTALAYYRRRILTSGRDVVTLGLLPLAALAFLGWVLVRSFAAAIPAQKWSLAAVLAVGVVLMLLARFVWRSPFFGLTREATGPHGSAAARA